MHLLALLSFFFILPSFSATTTEINTAISNASRNYFIDYRLIESIAFGISGMNAYMVNINGVMINPRSKDAAKYILNSNGWLANMDNGLISQKFIIDNPSTISTYISQYGASRDYSIKKINLSTVRVGLMGVIPYNSPIDTVLDLDNNISVATTKLKSHITKYGLKNALYIFCECQDPDAFVSRVASYYKKITGKKLETLYKQ